MRISDWSSDLCSSDLPRSPKLSTRAAYDRLGLRILTMHPEQLLAMKVMASRPRDVEDIRRLVTDLGITEVDEVIELTRRAFPRSEERRVGQECVSKCRSRWARFN